ncbi:hypothetical protein LCGC14_1277010 [marine sediment metagenome]|uniref:Uncharacterized protein n=1 Tax=marine sediment metagenome TaxID=412755 RepID=A0A0F9NCY9_9ZZZZ
MVEPITHAEVCVPMEGVRDWRNPRTKARVVEIHFRANPLKRTEEWVQKQMAQMDTMGFRREYDIDWRVLLGKPVYGEDWNEDIHLLPKMFTPEPGVPLLAGWDFQKYPSLVIAQWTSGKGEFPYDGRFVPFAEMQSEYLFASFLPEAISWRASLFPGFFFYDFCDPAGLSKSPTDEKSCFNLMTERGLAPIAGEQSLAARLGAVSGLLSTLRRGRPLMQVDQWGCPGVHAGFRGAYCFEEITGIDGTQYKEVPAKTSAADFHDALQYIATRLDVVRVPVADEERPLSKAWRFE